MKERSGFCLFHAIIECYMTIDLFLTKISSKLDFIVSNLFFFSFYELDFMIIWILLGINENVDRTNWASVGIHDMQI